MQKTLGIQDLEAYTGLPRRTIHFYVKEGLIPPPDGAGRGAYYGWHHVHALKLIGALKEGTYLRLEGIGEILGSMTPGEMEIWVRAIENGERTAGELAARQAASPIPADGPPTGEPVAGFDRTLIEEPARLYARELPQRGIIGEIAADDAEVDDEDAPDADEDAPEMDTDVARMLEHEEPVRARSRRGFDLLGFMRKRPTAEPPHETWERIRLADDVEIQVREGADRKRREQIQAIIRLAAEMLDD